MALRGKDNRTLCFFFCFCFVVFRTFGLVCFMPLSCLVCYAVSALLTLLWQSFDIRQKEKKPKSKLKRFSPLLATNGTDTMCLHYFVNFALSYFSLMGMMCSLATNIRKNYKSLQLFSYRVSVSSSSPALLSLQRRLSHRRIRCESGHSFPGSSQVPFTQEIVVFVKELFLGSETDVYFLPFNYDLNFIFRLCRHLW